MKAKPTKRESKGNHPRRSQRAGPEPVLRNPRERSDGVTFDIAKRKREEEDLRRIAQLYSRLFNSLDCIVWEADAKTFQFSFVSPQAERLLGYPVEQWLTPGFWAKHVHPEDVEWCTKFCVEATEHGRDHEFEYRMIADDGRTVWLHDVVSVQMSPEGPKLITGVMIDITEKKLAEETLRQSQDQLRNIVEAIPQQIWSASPEGSLDYCNEQCRSAQNMSLEELKGDGWQKTLHPDDLSHVLEAWRESVQNGTPFEHQHRYRMADGQYRWFLSRGVPLHDADGRIVRWYGTNIDIDDQKHAEEDLRRSEERVRIIFENSAVGAALLDRDGRILKCNPAVCRILGFTEGELQNVIFGKRSHPDDTEKEWTLFHELMAGSRDKYEMEKRYFRKDGSLVWGRLTASAIKDKNGVPEYAVKLVEDITERKRAEESLRESEERFRTIFENAGLGAALVDLQGHPIKCNPALQKMLGFTEDELCNMVFTGFTHPDDVDLDWKLFEELVAGTREKYEIEKRYIKKDGQLMCGQLTVSLVKNKDGTPGNYVVGMVEDITERKRAEELLRESEERFRTIFENAGFGMALVDLGGHLIKCNPALQKILGFTEDELRNTVFTEFTHPDDVELEWQLYGELVAGTRERYEIEKREIKKNGQLTWGHLIVSRVKSKDGAPAADYTIGMIEDISERKHAEQQLRAAHDQLTRELAERTRAEAEIVRLGERLISTQEEERTRVARELHDNLSQKVASIGIALSNIKRQIPDDLCETREQVERAYKRLLEVGEGVRHLSHELHPAILEHAGLVAALESFCTEFGGLAHVSAKVHAEGHFGDLPTNLQLGIYRIAQESLQNIRKHSKAKEGIIYLERYEERVQMRISDQGIGFDAAQPRKGWGLGLVSMRERARLLGGTLTVESSPGHGTTLIADVPVGSAALAEKDAG